MLFLAGTLLQVLELLQAARGSQADGHLSMTSATAKHEDESPTRARKHPSNLWEEIAKQVDAAVLNLLWLADPALLPCPPVRYTMLRVLEVLADLRGGERGTAGPIRSALRTSEDVNFVDVARPGSAGRIVPGRSVLVSAVVGAVVRRRLENALFGHARGDALLGKEGEEPSSFTAELQVVVELMWSADMDVRDAAIKATKKCLGRVCYSKVGGALWQPSLHAVWAGTAKALATETHPPNVRRLVRVLSRVGLHIEPCPLPTSSEPLWDRLRELCDDDAGVVSDDVHAGALEAMGVVMRLHQLGVKGFSTGAVDADDYANLLDCAADPDRAVSTRAAAAVSLASSELLAAVATDSNAGVPGEMDRRACSVGTLVRLWFVALSLLQDDDQRVRICTARACAAASIDGASMAGNGVDGVAAPRGGGRVDLCAVTVVLERLTTLAENRRDGGCAARELALNLLQAFASVPGTRAENLLTVVAAAEGKDDGNNMGVISQSASDLDEGLGEDANTIFGREERNQFQEPALFACISAPYMRRTLVALDARHGAFPDCVAQGLAGALCRLAGNLEALSGCSQGVPSATWLPPVYEELVSSAAVGAAILGFLTDRVRRKCGVNGDGGVGLLSNEVARVTQACENFDAILGGSERLHPEVSSGVALAMRAARSHTPAVGAT